MNYVCAPRPPPLPPPLVCCDLRGALLVADVTTASSEELVSSVMSGFQRFLSMPFVHRGANWRNKGWRNVLNTTIENKQTAEKTVSLYFLSVYTPTDLNDPIMLNSGMRSHVQPYKLTRAHTHTHTHTHPHTHIKSSNNVGLQLEMLIKSSKIML